MELEKLVVRIICGDNEKDRDGILGTGFFIDRSKVITAYHVVSNYYDLGDKIFVNPINVGDDKFYEAKIIELKKKSQIAILELNKEFDVHELKFTKNCTINPQKDQWRTFGYPKVRRRKGHIEKGLVSRLLSKLNSENTDIDLEISSSNINDFSGLSGAPFVIKDMLLGVIIEQSEAAGKIISIGAISINELKEVLPLKYITENMYKAKLKELSYKHTKNEINKNIVNKKYIKDIFVETSNLKEKTRYFTDKISFYYKLLDDIEDFTFRNLNYYLSKFNLPILKIEIEDELKINTNIYNINQRLDKIEVKIKDILSELNILDTKIEEKYKQDISPNRMFEFEQNIYKIQNERIIEQTLTEYLDNIRLMKASILMITAKAGQGKTNFICDFVLKFLHKKNIITLYFNAKDFNVFGIEKYIQDVVFKKEYTINEIKELLYEIRTNDNKDIVIIVDGLNENSNIAEFRENLILFIDEFKLSCKFILTCREEYFEERYEKLVVHFDKKELYQNKVNNLNRNDIEKERLFYGYFKFFNLSTANIGENVFNILTKDTLLLRTFCEAYGESNGNEQIVLPLMYDIYKYDVFKKYFDKKFLVIKEKKIIDIENCEKCSYEKLLSDIADYMILNKQYTDIPKNTINSFANKELLKDIVDEDIVFREDIIIKKGLINKEELVINFTFDEFRDYLIAKHLLELFGIKNSTEYYDLIHDITNDPSEVIEGVQKYLFYQGKIYNDKDFNEILYKQDWYEKVFLKNIYSVEDKYILGEDIEKISRIFKKDIKYSSRIIVNLLHRYDIKYFNKLNTETLINIILSLKEEEFKKLVTQTFIKSKGEYTFERKYMFFPMDNFLKFLYKLLDEKSKLDVYESLFKFLVIIIGTNYSVLNIFVEYLKREPNSAASILFKFSKTNLKVLNINVQKIINDVLSKNKELNLSEDISKSLKLIYDKSRKDFNCRGL
ncbi:S1 family peptidase [Clostridium intestinale]|uniref:Trypsin-like peptidase domain-containing protein n=1 Tax=Clostridium intestinale TaxID=36845 RepID=A0A7D6W2J3_9CLOT|nr:serine protease [Clostridium intestinale]QLY81225.1 trypsin-like peptidase domain-containing protein [Clostridium intestinale]